MKIALVSPYDFGYPGGVVIHVSHLARELEHMGHTVKILAPASSAQALGVDNLIAIGKPVPVPSGGSIARISLSVWLEHRIKGILKEEAFDVIHLHEPLAPLLPITVLRLSNTANVGTFHAFSKWGLKYLFSKRLVRPWFQKLDARIAVSEAARRYVNKAFPGEYSIIPNGVDLDFFGQEMPPLYAFNDDKLNILFVGRMEKRKGLRYLLGAFSRLKWEYPNLRLIVVGPGNPGKDCYRIMAERNLQDVVFVGGVNREMLARYYHTAHIFCSPATGQESFGMVLCEAMASRLPVVASDIDGFRSVMTNGQEGFLVPPKNEEALAAALERLIQDSNLRRQMGQQGRDAVQKYRWDLVASQVYQRYEEAVALHRSAKASETVLGV